MDLTCYRCPADGSPLTLTDGAAVSASGRRYPIHDGVPDFTWPSVLPVSDQESLAWYQANAAVYDEFLPLTFRTFGVDEWVARRRLVDALSVQPGQRIVELGCGTGRDSELIRQRMQGRGELFLQDLSPGILALAKAKLGEGDGALPLRYSLGNGCYLPYADRQFDRVFHFGGINTFGDIRRCFAEMVRIAKPGARIVVGDENMPVWLRQTSFGKILMNSNPHYRYHLPLEHLPVEARNVKIEWFIGGVFYFITFDVGEGEPPADLDFEIPGIRGGTHRTRYEGHLEGVTPEARELARQARQKSGKSMHAWLDQVIREAAARDLAR